MNNCKVPSREQAFSSTAQYLLARGRFNWSRFLAPSTRATPCVASGLALAEGVLHVPQGEDHVAQTCTQINQNPASLQEGRVVVPP